MPQRDCKPAVPYFFPDFLIPCWPAFKGPLPLAFSAISLFAFASGEGLVRLLSTGNHVRKVIHTGLQLLPIRNVILVQLLLLLLWRFQRLRFTPCTGNVSARARAKTQ